MERNQSLGGLEIHYSNDRITNPDERKTSNNLLKRRDSEHPDQREITGKLKIININLSNLGNGIFYWKVIDENLNTTTGRITVLKLN